MSKRVIFTNKAPRPVGPYSQAVIAGGFLFGSGQIPINPETGELISDIKEATRQVMENVKAVLETAGCTFDDVVSVTVFLADLGDFEAFNEVYSQYFKGAPPARTTVQAALPKGARLELNFVAKLPE